MGLLMEAAKRRAENDTPERMELNIFYVILFGWLDYIPLMKKTAKV